MWRNRMRNVVAILSIYYDDYGHDHDHDVVVDDARVDFDWSHVVHDDGEGQEYCYYWDGMDESMYSFVYHVH